MEIENGRITIDGTKYFTEELKEFMLITSLDNRPIPRFIHVLGQTVSFEEVSIFDETENVETSDDPDFVILAIKREEISYTWLKPSAMKPSEWNILIGYDNSKMFLVKVSWQEEVGTILEEKKFGTFIENETKNLITGNNILYS